MRLEDMSFTDYLMAEFDLRERQRKERMKKAEFEKYAKEHNIFYCTKELGEQIKVETPPIDCNYRKKQMELTFAHGSFSNYETSHYFNCKRCGAVGQYGVCEYCGSAEE